MAIDLNVPVVLSLQERLEDDLPAAITTINAERTDASDLVMPGSILPYIPPPSDLLAPPAIGIGDAPTRFEDDIASSATGRHGLLVVAYEQTAEQEALTWQLRWWAVAIARTILKERRLGSAAWGTGLTLVRPGPTLVDDPENPREWFSWVGVEIWAKSEEE